MPQQINLLTPILLAPKRHFSALTLLQAGAVLLLGGAVAALWLQQRDRSAEAQHQQLLARQAAERQQLTLARANLPAPQDATALQQQLQALQAGNADRAALLQTLTSADGNGPSHAQLLALVARTLPEAAWLTELRHAPGRLELAGGTLDTAQLRPWLDRLAGHALLQGQQLQALRVERLGQPGAESAGNPLRENAALLARAPLPVWSFRVVSGPAGAASGSAR